MPRRTYLHSGVCTSFRGKLPLGTCVKTWLRRKTGLHVTENPAEHLTTFWQSRLFNNNCSSISIGPQGRILLRLSKPYTFPVLSTPAFIMMRTSLLLCGPQSLSRAAALKVGGSSSLNLVSRAPIVAHVQLPRRMNATAAIPPTTEAPVQHAISNPTLVDIEKRWESMPPAEQAELWVALRKRMQVPNWTELTLQEKKAGMLFSFDLLAT